MAPLFQAREIPRIVPSLPPVKRLAADTEVATGQRRILSMPPVMVQPLQSCFCQPADPLNPAYDFGTRSSRTYYLHDDSILSVTYHYEREQSLDDSDRRHACCLLPPAINVPSTSVFPDDDNFIIFSSNRAIIWGRSIWLNLLCSHKGGTFDFTITMAMARLP